MELMRKLYACVPFIYLLIKGIIYLDTDNRTRLTMEMTY